MAVTQPVVEALNQASDLIKTAVTLSLNDIGDASNNEKEYIDLWVSFGMKIGQYFQMEAERTGNQQLARYIKKNMTKSIIFS